MRTNRNSQAPAVSLAVVDAALAEDLAQANLAAAVQQDAAAVQQDAVAPVPSMADAYADAMMVASGAPLVSAAPAARAHAGAKVALRALFDVPGSRYTLAELVTLTGKTEVNVRTQLSDMRSPKYAGKAGVYVTSSTRVGTVTYYAKA